MNVSVAMAVYNGEKYLRQQIESVIMQLGEEDELIISVDKSEDRSMSIACEYAKEHDNVTVLAGPCEGVERNFENAILSCKKDVIFLCDQDDVWEPDKVETIRGCFANNRVYVVIHDAYVTDENLNVIMESYFDYRKCKKGIIKNIWKNSYIGCCMAFRRELVKTVVPFPKSIPMHDQWIGIMGERKGKVIFIRKPLMKYRRHGENATRLQHAGFLTMLGWRLNLIWNLLIRKVE